MISLSLLSLDTALYLEFLQSRDSLIYANTWFDNNLNSSRI